jgi:hypothetical protein
VLFSQKVIVDPLLGITDDEEGSAGFADLHGLLLNVILVFVGVGRQHRPSKFVPFFSKLIAEFH